jgi:hypothetical protein
LPLACRVYKLEPTLQRQVRTLLLKSNLDEPHPYGSFESRDENLELSLVIRNRFQNNYGSEIKFWIDQILCLYDREKKEQHVRYVKTYDLQLIEGKSDFSNYIIVFGPKIIDSYLTKAIKNYLREQEKDDTPDPLILSKIDLKANLDSLMKEFPNLQHFCIRDIPDEKTKGIIVRGNSLEETDVFDRFVKDIDTSGEVNYLGITTEFGKLIYLGTDGSVYSRMNFTGEDRIKIVYDLYSRLKKINAFAVPLEHFTS